MAVTDRNEYQKEIEVLHQLLAVQNDISVFRSAEKIAEFSYEALKKVPGIHSCSYCLIGHSKPYGDRNKSADSLATELSDIREYKPVSRIDLPTGKDLRIFNIQSRRYFFGYVLILKSDSRSFEKFNAAISNHLNIVAINLENLLQNELLLKNERHLQSEAEKRTRELKMEIAGHLRSQKALKESHERYRELADTVPVGIFECDSKGNLKYGNNTALEWFGYTEKDLSDGLNIFGCTAEEECEKARSNFRKTLKTGNPSENEYAVRRKDGSYFNVIISSFPIYKNGKLTGLRGSMSDITERKNAEKVLLKSEIQFRTLFEKAQEGIMYLSLDSMAVSVNDAFTKIMGFTAEEIKSEMLSHVHRDFTSSGYYEKLMSVLRGENVNFEIDHPRKDGKLVTLDVNASTVVIGNEKYIIMLTRDITFRKKAELALKQKSGDLENLVDISNALITTVDFNDLLQKIVENAVKLHNLESGALYLVTGRELYLHATAPPLPPGVPDSLRIAKIDDHHHIRKALRTGKPVFMSDSSSEKLTPEEQEIVNLRHLVSCIYIPILVQKRSVGALILSTIEKKKVFTEDEISIYRMLSTQLGLVIENAMLFREKKDYTDELEQKNRDQQFLSELAFELAVMPANENLSRIIVQKLMSYTNATAAILTDYDPVSGCLVPEWIHTDRKFLRRILREGGKNLLKIKAKVSDEMHKRMLSEIAVTGSSLSSITYGAVPPMADKIISRIAGIKHYCGITLSGSGNLLGSITIALTEGQRIPSYGFMFSIGHIVSVTIQKRQAEKELRFSETRLSEIIRNVSDVICVIDSNGNMRFVSQNIEKCLGYTVSQYSGKPWMKFICPEDIPYMKGILSQLAKKQGVPVQFELRKICKDGSLKWVRGSAINLLDDPSIEGTLVNFEDVDKIKQSDESLVKFRLGIERSPEAMFITDPDGKITYINQAFTKIYGYTGEQAIGSTPRILKSGTVSDKAYSLFWKSLLSKYTIEGEIENKRKDGKLITIDGVNNPILDQKGEIIGFLGIHRDITARKKREEALKLSEEKFRKFFMISPDAININRLSDGVYIDVNDGFTDLTGYGREEVIGKSSFEINIWTDIKDRENLVNLLNKKGVVQNFEVKFAMKNGIVRNCMMSSSLILLNGDPHVMSATRDIEDIKRAQDALKESEERFKQVIKNSEEWIWEVDKNGMYTYASPVVEKILGYKPEDLVGKKHFYDLFPPEHKEKMKREAFKVFGEKAKFERFINKNLNSKGEPVFLETSGAPKLDPAGNLLGYLGADSNVTERILNEEKLRKLSLAVEQSPASIVITNTRGDIEYVNNRFLELTGYSRDDLSGNNPRVLKSGKTTPDEYKRMWECISAGKEWRCEFYNRKKNGEYFWESASISPIFDSEGKITHYLGVKEDITEKKNAAKFLIDKIIATEERERLRYSNELHDGLGPIISTIKLYFQLLNESSDAMHRKLIIEKADKCIDEAIQSLKEISHNLSPNVVNNFGLVTGVQSFINRLKDTDVFQITFNTDIEGRLDRNVEITLYRIITEMINNTYKYAEATAISIDLTYSVNESTVRLQYKDNGKGFDVERALQKGRGIGISNIYQRVNAMNGRVSIISSPGKGVFLIVELGSSLMDLE